VRKPFSTVDGNRISQSWGARWGRGTQGYGTGCGFKRRVGRNRKVGAANNGVEDDGGRWRKR